MNSTLAHLWSHIGMRLATRPHAIRKLVLADLDAGPPPAGELPQGHKLLRQACAGPSGNFPYYAAPTVVAAALAVFAAGGAYLVGTDPEPGPWSMAMTIALGAVAVVSLYQLVARRFGPAVISRERYAQARDSLAASGDALARPISTPLMAAMALMFTIDGAYSGYTITSHAFASLFTPRMAMFASLAWSAATAWLLAHLTLAAAHESTINARRDLLRKRLSSPRSADRERGEAMISHVGAALGNDFGTGANRIRARVALALVVLALTTATFVVRVSDETADFSVEPMPALVEGSAPTGFTN